MHLPLSEIFAVRVVHFCDMFDRLSIFAVERRRGMYCELYAVGTARLLACDLFDQEEEHQ